MEKLRKKNYLKNAKESEAISLLTEDSVQLANLHPKKREDLSPSVRQPRDQTIECDIQPSDTLHSLSLKYNVQLAELKRVNNIFQESEFFALKRIKIPVKPASFLIDLIPGVHSEESRNQNGWMVDHRNSTPQGISSHDSSRISSGYSSPCSEPENAVEESSYAKLFHESKDKKKMKKFFKEMDRDLARIKENQSNLNSMDTGDTNGTLLVDYEGAEASLVQSTSKETSQASVTTKPARVHAKRSSETADSDCSSQTMLGWCCLITFLIVGLFLIMVILMSTDHHASLFVEETKNASQPLVHDGPEAS